MFTKALVFLLVLVIFTFALGQTGPKVRTTHGPLPTGYWPIEKSQPIIDKSQTIRLAPNLSQLSAGERKAVAKLLEVGKIFRASTKIRDISKRVLRIAHWCSAKRETQPRKTCSRFIDSTRDRLLQPWITNANHFCR